MSILNKNFIQSINQNFTLTVVFCLTVIDVLEALKVPSLSIKWPNDIMSYQKKIGGILIENIIKSNQSIQSIIGLGLNVNQTDFENLPKASSLKKICNHDFDKNQIAFEIQKQFMINVENYQTNQFLYWQRFQNLLFRKNKPTTFKNNSLSQNFTAIILGVSPDGKLKMQLEDESIVYFENKEIEMLFL